MQTSAMTLIKDPRFAVHVVGMKYRERKIPRTRLSDLKVVI